MPGKKNGAPAAVGLDADHTVTKVPSSDEDMLDPWREAAANLAGMRRPRESDGPSPKRSRDLAVDVQALRAMLDDQSKAIMQAQERAVSQVIQGLEGRHGKILDCLAVQQDVQGTSLQHVEQRLQQQQERQDTMAGKLDGLMERLSKLEQTHSAASTGAETAEGRRTLQECPDLRRLAAGLQARDHPEAAKPACRPWGWSGPPTVNHTRLGPGRPLPLPVRSGAATASPPSKGNEAGTPHGLKGPCQAAPVWESSLDIECSSGTVWLGEHRIGSEHLLTWKDLAVKLRSPYR